MNRSILPPYVGAVNLSGSAFVLYAIASLLWTSADPLLSALHISSLVLAYFIGYHVAHIRPIWFWFAIALCLNFFLASIGWVFDSFPISPFGLFGNPNYLGCALALAFAASLVYRLWWFTPVAIGGLFYTQSRGAIFAAGIAAVIYLFPRYRVSAFVLGVLVVVAIVELSGGRSDSITQRLGIWQDTMSHLTIFGSGWGSFANAYASWPVRTNMTYLLAPHAYNDYLELVFELGIGATFLCVTIAFAFESPDLRSKTILLTGIMLSLTYFPLYIPVVGHLLALSLGHLARSIPRSVKCFAPA